MNLIMPNCWIGEGYRKWAVSFIPVVIFIITAVSNGANLTDGIDVLLQERLFLCSPWVFLLSFRKYNFFKLFKYYVYP
jgi:UDP-N-acetylmuramyl pentapeptide phosphotransferase/UDP-N-acetylglucosamine-1-phosphate transferase